MRNFILVNCFFITVWTGSALAQDNASSDFNLCAVKQDSAERLACYDAIVKKQNSSAINANDGIGRWEVTNEKSKLDDSTNVYLQLKSSDFFKDRWGKNNFVTFGISCLEHSTNVWFYFNDAIMSDIDGYGEVIYRLGSAKAITIQTTPSTDNKALGIWSGNGISFLKKVMGENKLILRASPYREGPVTVEFDTTGLSNAIKPLRRACAW